MKRRKSAFLLLMEIIAIAVSLFIFAAMAFIVIEGMPYAKDIFFNEEVIFAVGLSLKTALVSTAICLILGIPTAYAVTRENFRFRRICDVIVELPLSIPNLMIGLSLLLMFSSIPGKFLSAHGFRVIFNVNGIVIAQLMVNLPFVVRMIKTAFMELNPRYEIIAGSLGASPTKSFFLVSLPLVKNSVLGAFILAWSRALGEFGATLMLVGATRMKTETIPTSIYLNMATGDTGPAMACAMILLIISALSLILSNVLNWYSKKTAMQMEREEIR